MKSLSLVAIAGFGIFGFVSTASAQQGPLSPDATPRPPVVLKKTVKKPASIHSARVEKPAKPPQKEIEPWAAVDPTRAGLADQKAASAAPTPGIARTTPSNEPNTSIGLKWNSSNTPNYGAATTSGLINQYNNTLSGTDVGTTVETGVKFKF